MSEKGKDNQRTVTIDSASSSASTVPAQAATEKEARTDLTKPPPKKKKSDDIPERLGPSIPKRKSSFFGRKRSSKVGPAPDQSVTSQGTTSPKSSTTTSTSKKRGSLKSEGRSSLKAQTDDGRPGGKKVVENPSLWMPPGQVKKTQGNLGFSEKGKGSQKPSGTRAGSIDLKELLETPLVPIARRKIKVHPEVQGKPSFLASTTPIPWKEKRNQSKPELDVRSRRLSKQQSESGVKQSKPSHMLPDPKPSQIHKSVPKLPRVPLSLPAFKVPQQADDDTPPPGSTGGLPSANNSPRPSVWSFAMDNLYALSNAPSIMSLRESMPSLAGSRKPSEAETEAPKVKTKFSAMSLFLKDWRNQKLTELVVVPDPYDITELVIDLKYNAYTCMFTVFMCTLVIFSTFWYAGLQIASPMFARDEIYRIFYPWPRRYLGTVYEFWLTGFALCFYSIALLAYPIPSDWHIKCFHCNRLSRWLGYFTLVIYIFCINSYWISEIVEIPKRISDHMDETFLAYPNSSVARAIWNQTHHYFLCCGKNSYRDWEDPRVSYSPKVMHRFYDEQVRTELTYYMPNCCNYKVYVCADYPLNYEVWQSGCYDFNVILVLFVFITHVIAAYVLVGAAIAAYFYIFLVETVFLNAEEVPEEKSSYDWSNTKEAQQAAAEAPFLVDPPKNPLHKY